MINPTSCLIGNMPNNLDIDFSDVGQPGKISGYPAGLSSHGAPFNGQMDMSQFSSILQHPSGMAAAQN